MDAPSVNSPEALRKYGKDLNLQEFIRRFMGLMGSHLTVNAEIAEQTKPKPSRCRRRPARPAPPSRAKIVHPDLHPDSDSEDGDVQNFLIRPAAQQQQQPKQQLFVADRPREVDPAQMQRWLSDARLRAVLSDLDTCSPIIAPNPRRVWQYLSAGWVGVGPKSESQWKKRREIPFVL
jgi:hypothetical protein